MLKPTILRDDLVGLPSGMIVGPNSSHGLSLYVEEFVCAVIYRPYIQSANPLFEDPSRCDHWLLRKAN